MRKREKGKKKQGEVEEEEVDTKEKVVELDFGSNIDLDVIIKEADPNFRGFINQNPKSFFWTNTILTRFTLGGMRF